MRLFHLALGLMCICYAYWYKSIIKLRFIIDSLTCQLLMQLQRQMIFISFSGVVSLKVVTCMYSFPFIDVNFTLFTSKNIYFKSSNHLVTDFRGFFLVSQSAATERTEDIYMYTSISSISVSLFLTVCPSKYPAMHLAF